MANTNTLSLQRHLGNGNTGFGLSVLADNRTGGYNTAHGYNALFNNTADHNTACGAFALNANDTGSANTATGAYALYSNLGSSNTASGYAALFSNTTGTENTASGLLALGVNTTGGNNTATGSQALSSNTAGLGNTAMGYLALQNCTGNFNTGIGNTAGSALTTGDRNICINYGGVAGDSNTIRIGNSAFTRAFIAGIRGRTTGVADAITVVIDGAGQLGTMNSSRRYKEDIADMGEASARLQSLRPVTFRYTKPYANGQKPVQFGLIAEEVAEVFPELAVRNAEGQPETVKYQDLTPLLLNEVQKQQRRADAKDAEIAELKKRLAAQEERLSRIEQFIPAREASPAQVTLK